MRAARDAPRGAVLDYVADSRHAAGLPDSTERLDLLAMASLLLSDGSGEAVNKTAEQVSAALSGAADEQQTGPVWPALLSGARQHITDLRAQHAQDLEEQRLSHEAKLEELRREAEQLNRRVEHLQAQIAEGREELRMDILQDMLSVIAETLQSLPEWTDNPEALAKNVEARLVLALGAGGAERVRNHWRNCSLRSQKHHVRCHDSRRITGARLWTGGYLSGQTDWRPGAHSRPVVQFRRFIMQVVGVDFGTTNIRIATWDSARPEVIPESRFIGQGDTSDHARGDCASKAA